MKATYTKLRNGWGARVIEGTPAPGQTITLTTKAGKVKTETVSAVIWQGKDKYTGQSVALCTLAQQARSSKGYAPGKRCYCSECGEPYRKGQRCWETGGQCVPEWE